MCPATASLRTYDVTSVLANNVLPNALRVFIPTSANTTAGSVARSVATQHVGGPRQLVAQRRLAGGQDEHPIQPKLPPCGGGDGDMPFVGRIEGPSEDAEHGGHGGITPPAARSGNPKQA